MKLLLFQENKNMTRNLQSCKWQQIFQNLSPNLTIGEIRKYIPKISPEYIRFLALKFDYQLKRIRKIRNTWEERFNNLPPNLTQLQLKYRFKQYHIQTIIAWANTFNYKIRSKIRKNNNNYNFHRYKNLDWIKQDTELAKECKVTRERIRQVRNALKKSPSPYKWMSKKGILFLQWINNNRQLSNKLTIRELSARVKNDKISITDYSIRKLSRKYKFRIASSILTSQFNIIPVNWNLPNIYIERIWNLSYNSAANYRCEHQLPSSKWRMRFSYTPNNLSLRKAILLEQAKRNKFFTRKNIRQELLRKTRGISIR